MHLPTIATALLLPVLAAADSLSSTTATMTSTMTQTVTLMRAHTVTSTLAYNSTTSYMPTGGSGTTTSFVAPTTTGPSASVSPISKNAGSTLGAAHVVIAGIAGVVVVAMM
jgi:hypothetical protein